MKRLGILMTLLGGLWTGLCHAGAAPEGTPLARTILAFHDPAQPYEDSRFQPMHQWGEMILNHLGLQVHYLDVNAPLPALATLEGVLGVVIWLKEPFPNPEPVMNWLEGLLDDGRKVVVLGELPFTGQDPRRAPTLERINRFWKRLGLRQDGEWVELTYKVNLLHKDPVMVEFERPLTGLLPPYERVSIIDGRVRAHLTVNHAPDPETASVLVATGPSGGYVCVNYASYRKVEETRQQWYINPLAFFRLALGLEPHRPIPDAATLSGRRIFYSHIDGDGWRNVTEIRPYRAKNTLASEVILKEILEPYAEFPVTVAPIAGDLDTDWFGTPATQEIARRIFALPHVEVGSHTYSHPLDWLFFQDYTPAKEEPFLALYPKKGIRSIPATLKSWLLPKKLLAHDVSLMQTQEYLQQLQRAMGLSPSGSSRPAQEKVDLSMGHEIPRAYGVKEFDLEHEIGGAIRYVQQFAPADKRVEVYQWSGNTHPFEAAMELTRKLGVRDINGGDTRFDQEYPSLSWIAPLGREVGRYRQVYASNSNENTYTDLWTDRFFGFKHLVRTLENTETPWRFKPLNIYYHIYSGEKLSSLNAVRNNLDYARQQDLAPVATSHFSRIVEGFSTSRIQSLGEDRWSMTDRGALQTLRFDHATHLALDWTRSSGVVGERHYQGSLYVSLDEAHPEAVVALSPHLRPDLAPPAPHPYLMEGRWRVWGMVAEADGVQFQTQGFGEGSMTWWVPHGGRYRIIWRPTRGETWQAEVPTTEGHELAMKLPAQALQGGEVRIKRLKGAGA